MPVVHSGGQQRPLYTLALWNLQVNLSSVLRLWPRSRSWTVLDTGSLAHLVGSSSRSCSYPKLLESALKVKPKARPKVLAFAGGGASSSSSSRRVVSSSELLWTWQGIFPIIGNISTSQLVDGLRCYHPAQGRPGASPRGKFSSHGQELHLAGWGDWISWASGFTSCSGIGSQLAWSNSRSIRLSPGARRGLETKVWVWKDWKLFVSALTWTDGSGSQTICGTVRREGQGCVGFAHP